MKKLFLLFGAVMLIASCSDDPQQEGKQEEPTPEPVVDVVQEVIPGVDISLTSAESVAASAQKAFEYDFFAAMSSVHGTRSNMVCSPASASVLLSMLANASTDKARAEILSTLGCEDIDALNSLAFKKLTQLPVSDPQVALHFANALWYSDALTIDANFAKTMSENYGMESYARKFDSSLPGEVNSWIDEKTNGIIKQIITGTPSAECAALLVNSLYFKGAWSIKFDKKETKRETFHGVGGDSKVSMMHNVETQLFYRGYDFRAVKMQIGTKGFEAIFVLPDEGISIADFIKNDGLKYAGEHDYCEQIIDFKLPKFKFNSLEMNLAAPMAQMGVKEIGNLSNLSAFTGNVNAKQEISQKISLEFNEEGAEAAAATFSFWSHGPEPEYPEVYFNRPYIFMIREAQTGAILFAGQILKL